MQGGATPKGWRDTIYYRYMDGGHGVAQHSAIRTNDFKLLYFDRPRNEAEQNSRWELFDLRNDPQELSNLAADRVHAQKLKSLKDRFASTRKFYDDTNENVWQRGPGKRYASETYIRPPRKR
jgi:arylsulfatase A-like enzyme